MNVDSLISDLTDSLLDPFGAIDESKLNQLRLAPKNEEQAKAYQRLVRASNNNLFQYEAPNPVIKEELANNELLALHERIIDSQDQQLDSLSLLIGRQRDIGEAIAEELESQVGLLQDVDDGVNNQISGLNRIGRRMETLMEDSSQESKLCIITCVVFLILTIVVVLTRL